MRRLTFYHWVFFALLFRLIAAKTVSHWFHPDEWFQTLEPANLIAHGFGTHTQEVGLHLRNLTWPTLLAGVLKLSQWVLPNSIDLRLFSVQAFCGILDLGILWGWWQVLSIQFPKISPALKNWSMALLLLPWFTIQPGINLRTEHLSEISFWLALGFFSRKMWVSTGFASIGIFAFRYPSAVLSLGIFLGVLLHKEKQILKKVLLGYGIGVFIFGMPDWLIYGRPWESFWMYLQYNIFTGSSTLAFGQQGIEVYPELFLWNWFTYSAFIPLGAFLLLASVYGFSWGIKNRAVWAICLLIYLAAHLLVPHKESRFMVPIEILWRWSAWVGLSLGIRFFRQAQPWLKKTFQIYVTLLIVYNSFLILHHLRADFLKYRGTYRELLSHLNENQNVCGIMSVQNPSSILIPWGAEIPLPALGYLNFYGIHLDHYQVSQLKMEWFERLPSCQPQDQVLVHLFKPNLEWEHQGCHLLASSILKFIPKSKWSWAIEKNQVNGPWYRCPSQVLSLIHHQTQVKRMSSSFGYIPKLPNLGITPEELQNLGYQTSPPPPDAVLPKIRR